MNFGNRVGSVTAASGSCARRAPEPVFDHFPAGLRVLVVDDDITCLRILEKMLQRCAYEVTVCDRAETALARLREHQNDYDIVLSDVHMPDMDGLKLLEYIGLEMDLPVIMMSADDGKSVVLKGVAHGACDYMIKPVRIEALKNIWQHVVRKKKYEFKEVERSGSMEDGGDRQQRMSEDGGGSSTGNEGSSRSSKRRKEDQDEAEEKDDSSTLKKPRVVWSVDLHQQFVAAVNQLGIEKAVPKKILELMNVPGLTRENVASHLQKYRLYLRRLSGQTTHQSGINNAYFSSQEVAFGQMPSLSPIELQALTANGQFPSQSLAALQAVGLGRYTAKSGLPMSILDQRNLFSFESPSLCFDEARQQKLSNSSKPMNLLHGIPTTVEPKQLANMHQSAQTFRGVNMQVSGQGNQTSPLSMQGQLQSKGQILNETSIGGHVSRLPLPMAQPILSNGISSGVMTRNVSVGYNSVSQAPTMVDFPLNHTTDLVGKCFPPENILGMPSLKATGMFQDMVNSEMKLSKGLAPCYDIFNDTQHQKSQNWELQGLNLTFDASQHVNCLQDNLNSSSPVMVHEGFSSAHRQNRNASCIGRPVFLSSKEFGNMNGQNADQQLNTLPDILSRIKAENIPNSSHEAAIIPGNFGHQEDLLNAFLKQQEGIGPIGGEFDMDGFPLENTPVYMKEQDSIGSS